MNTSTKALSWAALAALTVASTTAAQAGLFDLNYTGSFSSATTLGGTPLGADTPFSMVATFDSNNNIGINGLRGVGLYPVTALSLTLAGANYTAIPDSNLNVVLTDNTYNSNSHLVGLYVYSNGSAPQYYYSVFDAQSNSSFDIDALSDNTYSGYRVNPVSGTYSISLVGVSGGLANMRNGTTTPTASISTAAVPEPVEYAAVTGLALGVFALVQRRRQAAGR